MMMVRMRGENPVRALLSSLLILAVPASAAVCPAKGAQAPLFSFPLAHGGRISRADLLAKRQAAVISFWRHDCVPCRAELPALQKLAAEWGDRVGVVIVHVGESEQEVLAFLDGQKLALSAALDLSEKISRERFCVSGLPRLFVLDAKGNLAKDMEGGVANFEATLRAAVQPLLH